MEFQINCFDVEVSLRRGLHQGYGMYEFSSGASVVKETLSDNSNNVHAAASLAWLYALSEKWDDCTKEIDYVTALDPLHPEISSIVNICRRRGLENN